MPDFNFKPSVMGVSFYRGQRGLDGDDYIVEVKLDDPEHLKGTEVFELGMRITLGGLDYLRHPLTPVEEIDDNYVPFYLNIATYTQRGQRDIVVGGVFSQYFDKERLKKGSETLQLTLTKFRNDMPIRFEGDSHDFKYDFIQNIYFVKVFTTDYDIQTKEQLSEEIFGLNQYNVLFETKIPYANTKVWEWER